MSNNVDLTIPQPFLRPFPDPADVFAEEQYCEALAVERRRFAWTLVRHGGRTAKEAECRACEFYRHESADSPNRGLVFHDEAWHWAMLELFGEGYWRDREDLASPPAEYYEIVIIGRQDD